MSMSLRWRVIIILTVVGLLPMAIVGTFSVTKGKGALVDRTIESLIDRADQKKLQLVSSVDMLQRTMELMSSSEDAMVSLFTFNDYYEENEVSINEKLDITTEEYSLAWKTNIGMLKKYADKFKYDDVLILNKDSGHIIFSLKKGSDLGISVKSQSYLGSGISKLLDEVSNERKLIFYDFEIYPDGSGQPFALLGAPINDSKGKYTGVIVAKIGTSYFDEIMTQNNNGKSDTISYLVGPDYLLRSNIQKYGMTSSSSIINKKTVKTDAIQKAFSGNDVSEVIENFWKKEVVSSILTIEAIPGIKWAIVTELPADIAFESSRSLTIWFAVFFIIAIFVIIAIGAFIGEAIVRPISRVGNMLAISAAKVKDSSSELSNSSEVLSRSNYEQEGKVAQMSEAIEELTGMVKQNEENAELSNEISVGVREISENGNATVKELINSMDQISESNKTVEGLLDVISAIAEKTAVIDEIVFQTKLLSFNASVEAERAGEHGRGFAVVAQEVGNLASLSGKAATEISAIVNDSVKTVDKVSKETVEKVLHGSKVVVRVEKIFGEILEQSQKVSSSSAEILNASKEQSIGINSIREAVNGIELSIRSTTENSKSTENNSKGLSEEANTLQVAVDDLGYIISGK